MSGTFSGFSEEDIRKLKSGSSQPEAHLLDQRKIVKAKRRSNEGTVRSNNRNLVLRSTRAIFEVPEGAKLNLNNDNKENIANLKTNSASMDSTEKQNKDNNLKNESEKTQEKSNKSVTIDPSKIEKRVIDLDEFQARQKLIEEQNRKRKELLAKALADRTKQTEEEARRLKEIQNEFKKLDALLSNDVSILRHQIEVASLEFMEAQKKYHRIEKEFLDAKLNLHQKLERKEMLTEHLCAIIERNEERKAEKLSELMNRLEVDDKGVEDIGTETIKDEKKDCQENGANLIEEVKNRREIKIDLHPEKMKDTTTVIENGTDKL